ncbi:MAG: hypothetical protein LUG83_04940, partial [Lachnospiraceae bacterium]|nr:hypothetical protein [Lachnospiraceae bacterium]
MYQKKKEIEKILVLLLDLVCIAVSYFVGCSIRFGWIRYSVMSNEMQFTLALILLVYIGMNFAMDMYHHFFQRGYMEEFREVVKAEITLFIITITITYLLHRPEEDPSRLALGYFLIVNSILTYTLRLVFKQIMTKFYSRSRYSSRLLVITNSRRAKGIVDNILRYNEWYRQVVGIALTDDSETKVVDGIPVVAYTDSLMGYVIRNDVDEVFIADENLTGTSLLKAWISEFGQMGIDVN